MKKEDVKGQYLSFSESADQFKDKHIDAFIVTAGVPNAAIMDVARHAEASASSRSPTTRPATLTKKYPFLAPATIPANTYKNQTAEVKTVAVHGSAHRQS